MPVDVSATGADFYAFTGHKMLGPDRHRRAVGAARAARGDAAVPGRRVDDQARSRTTTRPGPRSPAKFEAGTPAIAEGAGLGAAVDYLTGLGMEAVRAHERELTALRARAAVGASTGVTRLRARATPPSAAAS